jgi:hypothetical protein
MIVSLDEFLRRFLLHLLPKGFVRIRHFGFLANRRRSTLLPLCFAALGTVPMQIEPETSGHNCGMKLLAHNSKTPHGSPRSAPVRPAPDPIPTSRPLSHRLRLSTPAPTPSQTSFSASVPTPANFNTSPSLHSICIRPASAAPAAFLLTAFSNARHNPLFRSTLLTKGAPPKKH